MNIEPAMLLRRTNNSSPMFARITPSLSVKDIWYVDMTSPVVDHVWVNNIVFVTAVVSGPCDIKVSMLITSRGIGWYAIRDVEDSESWEEV